MHRSSSTSLAPVDDALSSAACRPAERLGAALTIAALLLPGPRAARSGHKRVISYYYAPPRYGYDNLSAFAY